MQPTPPQGLRPQGLRYVTWPKFCRGSKAPALEISASAWRTHLRSVANWHKVFRLGTNLKHWISQDACPVKKEDDDLVESHGRQLIPWRNPHLVADCPLEISWFPTRSAMLKTPRMSSQLGKKKWSSRNPIESQLTGLVFQIISVETHHRLRRFLGRPSSHQGIQGILGDPGDPGARAAQQLPHAPEDLLVPLPLGMGAIGDRPDNFGQGTDRRRWNLTQPKILWCVEVIWYDEWPGRIGRFRNRISPDMIPTNWNEEYEPNKTAESL